MTSSSQVDRSVTDADSLPASGSSHTIQAKEGLSLLFAASILRGEEDKDEPRQMDVLCGRGGGVNRHMGNRMYRRVVDYNKTIYRQVPKRHRMLVSQSIVQCILNGGGRFLQQRKNGWVEIPFRKAVQKTSQALRERADEPRSSIASSEDSTQQSEEQSEGESHTL
jgi:hypothetical protein